MPAPGVMNDPRFPLPETMAVRGIDVASPVRGNAAPCGIGRERRSASHRADAVMRDERFDASTIHTPAFATEDWREALRDARGRVDGALGVLVRDVPVARGRVDRPRLSPLEPVVDDDAT